MPGVSFRMPVPLLAPLVLGLWLYAGGPAAAQTVPLSPPSEGFTLPHVEAPLVPGPQSYRRLALLLPWSSPNAAAAQAFYDGFEAARALDSSWRPDIMSYDIGADPGLSPLYYQAALQDGADFVIGPLGQRAVEALVATYPTHPTMVIGRIPENSARVWLYGLGLSLQNEAELIAERMYAAGHRQIGILREGNDRAARLAAVFARRWTSLGGRLILREVLTGAEGQAEQIQKMLHVDRSRHRRAVLARILDQSLSFTPRRRQDVSALFLAVGARQAREWIPQLRFHQGHDLALYATSRVYGGRPDKLLDADLEGVEFCDLPWILRPDALDPEAEDRPNGPFDRYRHSPLERLFVLGYAGYRLIPELAELRGRAGKWHRTGLLEVELPEDGNLRPTLSCAVFRDGRPQPRIGP